MAGLPEDGVRKAGGPEAVVAEPGVREVVMHEAGVPVPGVLTPGVPVASPDPAPTAGALETGGPGMPSTLLAAGTAAAAAAGGVPEGFPGMRVARRWPSLALALREHQAGHEGDKGLAGRGRGRGG